LVLYKVSKHHNKYINIKLTSLNNIVLTGGITKVLSDNDIDMIIEFFYKKILNYHTYPKIVIDRDYKIWTIGSQNVSK
jgi:D-mannonate dehydratase